MDITKLKSLIKASPESYDEEHSKYLELYKTLSKLPKKPVKELSRILDFLCFCSKFYLSEFSQILINHSNNENDENIKEELFKSILHQKKADLIEPLKFFELVFKRDKKVSLKFLQLELLKNSLTQREELFDLFSGFLENGTNSQKSLACFLSIFLYENTTEKILEERMKKKIIESLFYEIKTSKMVVLYFLNSVSFEIKSDEMKHSAFKTKKNPCKRKRIEDKINETKIEEDNFFSTVITKLSEKSKIVYSLIKKEADEISKKLFDHVKSHIEERKYRILRLKIIGLLKVEFELKIKIYNFILKILDQKNDDIKILISILIDSLDKSEAIKCIKMILDVFCPEYRDDDIIAFGLNAIKEICLKFEDIREETKEMVKIYRNMKDRAVFYAFTSLMRAIRYGITNKKEVDYIRRKKNKKKFKFCDDDN